MVQETFLLNYCFGNWREPDTPEE